MFDYTAVVAWRSWLIVAVLAYLVIDFSSPMAPGVFEFDPDQSVDCARTESPHVIQQDAAVTRVPIAPASLPPAREVTCRMSARPPRPLRSTARDRLIAAPPSASSEDH